MIKTGQNIDATDLVLALTAGEALSARDACYISSSDGKVYKCDADDTAKLGFIGFAQEAAVLNGAVNLVYANHMGGFSALTIGAPYYISGTAGAVTATAPTNVVRVGTAVSATQILISNRIHRAAGNGTSLGTASSSQAITTGFRPVKIKVHVRGVEQNTPSKLHTLDFVWLNGAIFGVAVNDENTSSVTDNNLRLYDGTGAYMTFSITSVTATGFTITWTETGTFSLDSTAYFWEAEGEQ